MVRQCQVWEHALTATRAHERPFADVVVSVTLTAPSGALKHLEAYYDGQRTWRVRFGPDEAGTWLYASVSDPPDPGLAETGEFSVEPFADTRGFLQAERNVGWGFRWANGEPAFLLGDTVYNLFGYEHAGHDTRALLEHRKQQGFNIFRVRAHCSPFHQPNQHSTWQTRDSWPWGGIPLDPFFDQLNLDYFRSVDRVVALCQELDVGIELIFEAWMFEFPFNDRRLFTTEAEELWVRYLVARYGAFRSVYMWDLANEYIYYPNGNIRWLPWQLADTLPDRWMARLARLVKSIDPHEHPVAVHTMHLPHPTYAQRLRRYPEIDVILFQDWGERGERGWTGAGIDAAIRDQVGDALQVAVMSEYGYETPPQLARPERPWVFDHEHTRRGAWRSAFCGVTVMAGFGNTWGPNMTLECDAVGANQLIHLRHFFENIVPFADLRPVTALATGGQPAQIGGDPLVLADAGRATVTVYLPLGGSAVLGSCIDTTYQGTWYDPRTGALHAARPTGGTWEPPGRGNTDDWVLLLRQPSGGIP